MTKKNFNKRHGIIALIVATAIVLGMAAYGVLANVLLVVGITLLGIIVIDVPLILLMASVAKKMKQKDSAKRSQESVSGIRIPETANQSS